MKDIKSYVIGFLSCACLFLIMGQTSARNGLWKNIDTYKKRVTNKQLDKKINDIKWTVNKIKWTVDDISDRVGYPVSAKP